MEQDSFCFLKQARCISRSKNMFQSPLPDWKYVFFLSGSDIKDGIQLVWGGTHPVYWRECILLHGTRHILLRETSKMHFKIKKHVLISTSWLRICIFLSGSDIRDGIQLVRSGTHPVYWRENAFCLMEQEAFCFMKQARCISRWKNMFQSLLPDKKYVFFYQEVTLEMEFN